jgi:hypothetical protein
MEVNMQPTQPIPSARGFFAALYDFSFADFVTPRMVRVIYIIALVAVALWCLGLLFSGFGTVMLGVRLQENPYGGGGGGLAFLGFAQIIGAPILFVIFSIIARMQLEILMAIFRIAENTTAMLGHSERGVNPLP